jgi:hypothetical protein
MVNHPNGNQRLIEAQIDGATLVCSKAETGTTRNLDEIGADELTKLGSRWTPRASSRGAAWATEQTPEGTLVSLSNFERYERIAWVYDLLDLPFEYGRYRHRRVSLLPGDLTDSRVLPGAKKPCEGQPREGAPAGQTKKLGEHVNTQVNTSRR